VEYFHKIVACFRYDEGLQGELTEVDQIFRMEPKVVQCLPEPEGQVGSSEVPPKLGEHGFPVLLAASALARWKIILRTRSR